MSTYDESTDGGKNDGSLAALSSTYEEEPSGPIQSNDGARSDSGEIVADRFALIGLVGSGRFGHVFKALDLKLEETIALKTLDPEVVDDEKTISRFQREVRLARRVHHKFVAEMYEFGTWEERPFLTMEYVEGQPLKAMINRAGRLDIRRTIEVVRDICIGLGAIHEVGVVHRDLKPANILMDENDHPVVTDFGIARAMSDSDGRTSLTTPGNILGTPAYIAPEQLKDASSVDPRADLYSLGVLLFELLCGERPWESRPNESSPFARLFHEAPDLQDRVSRPVPDRLVDIVDRCLALEPDDRFSSVSELDDALADCWDRLDDSPSGLEVPTHNTGLASTSSSFAESHYLRKGIAVLPIEPHDSSLSAEIVAGLTTELITDLNAFSDLEVRSFQTVHRYVERQTEVDARSTALALETDVVIKGGLDRTAGGDLSLDLTVLAAEEGFSLWSGQIETPPEELLEASLQAARTAASVLLSEHTGISRPVFTHPKGTPAYLEGRAALEPNTDLETVRALELLEEARQVAPDNPRVLGELARAHRQWAAKDNDRRRHHLEEARHFARASIRQHRHNGRGWYVLASALFEDGFLESAATALYQVLQRQPQWSKPYVLLVRLLARVNRLSLAETYLDRALEIDPYRMDVQRIAAKTLALRGEWGEVRRIVPRLNATPRGALHAARFALWGDFSISSTDPGSTTDTQAEEKRWIETLTDIRHGGVLTDDQYHTLDRLTQRHPPRSPRGLGFRQILCELLASVDAYDRALSCLREAIEGGLDDYGWLVHCPCLDPLRQSPAWSSLANRVQGRTESAARRVRSW
ncbi:MAG: protein kinase [Bradymonadaceae bacterium]